MWSCRSTYLYGFCAAWAVMAAHAMAGPAGKLLEVDYNSLAHYSDLRLDGPVSRSEGGLPVGNGRIGSLVWTSPHALHLQVNRVDVFGNDCSSRSFPVRNSDYCGGCGFVDVDFGSQGGGLFSNGTMTQHLDCSIGAATVTGREVELRVLAWTDDDVMAIEVNDHRLVPGPIDVNLRMLRPAETLHNRQSAISKVSSSGARIALGQDFDEDDYHCGSALALSISGRRAQVRPIDQGISLAVPAGKGRFAIFIGSAASFERGSDLNRQAVDCMVAAAKRGFGGLVADNARWWGDFWRKGFVHLHSADGIADHIEQNYTYYLYLLGSTSRGAYPAKFNGMLWTTGGDRRQWGNQFWGANQSCLYNALFAANRLDLLDPMFRMYSKMRDSLVLAARQQWGSAGIYIPETVAFNGLAPLPDDIAAEMRDLYLVRKPWSQVSQRFLDYAAERQPHSSRWNWISGGSMVGRKWVPTHRPEAPFGPVTHIFSRGAKIAYQYWMRYQYTTDKDWLRNAGYPVIKGVAEFYRNFPNLKKESDGRYHIYYVNSNESVEGARDTDEEISSMMALFPAAIRSSEILEVDAGLRTKWKEVLDHLAPLPTSGMTPAMPPPTGAGLGERGGRTQASDGRPVWIRGLPPIISGSGNGRPDGNTMPMWMFDLCTLENPDAATMAIASATFDRYRRGGEEPARIGVLSKLGVTAAMMGRAGEVRSMLQGQLDYPDRAPIMENRMDMREGPQTTNAQRLGRVADALQTALVQSVGPGPATEPVIRVFPAWPKDWNADFTLLCRGGFLVTSSFLRGKIRFVEIVSQDGGLCRVRNPWGEGAPVTPWLNGAKTEPVEGSLLNFKTAKDDILILVPREIDPGSLRRPVRR